MGIRQGPKSVSLFGEDGLLAAFSKTSTKIDTATLDIGPSDVGRVRSGNNQMNPAGQFVPSTIVSPQPGWLPIIQSTFALLSILKVISSYLDDMDEEVNSGDNSVRHKFIQRYQIVDFNQMLPESS